MGPPPTNSWDVRPTNLFQIYQPEDVESMGLCGNLLIEVDNMGIPARHFRFAVYDEELIAITIPADKISSMPGCTAFKIVFQFRPDEIKFRNNTFSEDWMDITTMVKAGKALPTIEEADHTDEFLKIAETAHEADHTRGGVLRWCINVTHTEELELCLMNLPVALSGIAGRPAFKRDTCPGQVIWRHHIEADYVINGPLKGPRPTLFAPDHKTAAAAISHNPSMLKTGKKNIYKFFFFFTDI